MYVAVMVREDPKDGRERARISTAPRRKKNGENCAPPDGGAFNTKRGRKENWPTLIGAIITFCTKGKVAADTKKGGEKEKSRNKIKSGGGVHEGVLRREE